MFFRKKDREEAEARCQDRLPPGQALTRKWPVLHVGSVPQYHDLSLWDFYIRGRVEQPKRFTWAEFSSLPMKVQINDMHCVTQWSKFDNTFEGIPVAEVIKHCDFPARRHPRHGSRRSRLHDQHSAGRFFG